jgi:hypothetical protein
VSVEEGVSLKEKSLYEFLIEIYIKINKQDEGLKGSYL